MGRTKHGLPPRSKSEREFDHESRNIVFVLNAIDAGRVDHLFVDAETKAAVRADWMAKGEAVVRKYVRAYPGKFYETPDGKIGGLPEGANKARRAIMNRYDDHRRSRPRRLEAPLRQISEPR
jgi:hypothetical protein